jgi:predicted Zn-dependent protease
MKLENRIPEEGINASHENPLKEFAWLLGGSIVVLVALAAAIGWGAGWLAPHIPYKYEARLAGDLDLTQPPASADARAAQAELQALADRLAKRMDLPEGMAVRVGFRDDKTVNAFATVGGQTVFFRGLLGKLQSEDALAMVMAHEIAHLKYRHPAQALGRGLGVGIVLSVVSSELGQSAAGGVLSQAGVTTLMAFNRDQEREADEEALRVIAAEYGHVGGALDLFNVFLNLPAESRASGVPQVEFLRTHPLTASRVEAVRAWAQARSVALDGPRRPLPAALNVVRPKD